MHGQSASVFSAVRGLRTGASPHGIHLTRELMAAQLNDLDTLTSTQFRFVTKLRSAWQNQNRSQVFALIEGGVEEYFDPESPSSLVHLIGCGGLCVLAEMVFSDADWFLRANHRHDEIRALSCLNTVIRIMTEAIVVDAGMGWYFFEAFPGLFQRLAWLAKVKRLQDSCIMLMEHTVSVVGPVIDLASSPDFLRMIRSADDALLASLCRVLALLLVSGAISEQSTCSFKLEAFPQCVTRLRRIEQVLKSNSAKLLEIDGLLERLLRLSEVQADGIRIFAGNRTVTVITQGPHNLPIVDFGDGEGPEDDEFAAQDFMQLLQSSIPGAQLHGMAGTPAMGPLGGGADPAAASGASLMQLLQNLMASNGGQQAAAQGGSAAGASASTAPMDAGAAATTAAGGAEIPPQSLQDLAEHIGDEIPPLNDQDAIDFSWFVGRSDNRSKWRLRNLLVGDEHLASSVAVMNASANKEKKFLAEKKYMAALQAAAARTSLPREQWDRFERQTIVNSQSEVLFVLNTLLSSESYHKSWRILAKSQLLARLCPVFDIVFFVSGVTNSVNVNRPSGSSNGGASAGGSRQRQRCTKENTIDGACELPDDDLSVLASIVDEDDANHRHDPDTLRKIELTRLIQEFWSAQDRFDVWRQLEDRGLCASRRELSTRITRQLMLAKEDPCTETLLSHALEGYFKCIPMAERARESHRVGIELGLINHILRRRIYEFSPEPGQYNSIIPLKRTEAFLSVVGELCRYSMLCLSHLNDVLSGGVMFAAGSVTLPDDFSPPAGAPTVPPQRTVAFRVLFERIVQRFPFDANLMVRSFFLPTMSGVRSWKNMLDPPPPPSAGPDALLRWQQADDTVLTLRTVLRRIESSAVVLARFFFARAEANRLTDELYEHVALEWQGHDGMRPSGARSVEEFHHLGSRAGLPSVCDMRGMLKDLILAPSEPSNGERPFPRFFSEGELELVNGVGEDVHVVVHRVADTALSREQKASVCFAAADPESPHPPDFPGEPGYFYAAPSFPAIEAFLHNNVATIVYRTICDVEAQDMENTEKLCAITTTLLAFLHCFVERGEAGVVTLLDEVLRLHFEELTSFDAKLSNLTAPAAGDASFFAKCRDHQRNANPELVPNCCSAISVFDERFRLDNPGREYFLRGTNEENSDALKGRAKYDPEGITKPCPFANLFQLLCVWTTHYSCCQRFFETLFFSTQVPLFEWKHVLLLIFRHIPRYFTFVTGLPDAVLQKGISISTEHVALH